MRYVVIAVLLSWTALVSGYQPFQQKIPNGNAVPHPCNTGTLWPGVGHEAPGGAGARNPFGLDFMANNKTWTAALCQKDSDGDGVSNGAELGDPTCAWTAGSTPAGPAKTHPGVCDPVGSDKCKAINKFISCPSSSAASWKNFHLHFAILVLFCLKHLM